MKSRARKSKIRRKTSETDIEVGLNLDGNGSSKINTGIPFLDHMLILFSKHGLFEISLKAKGDLDVDIRHTNEDVGIALGQAFGKAIGTKKGIRRYGFFSLPMDESLVRVSLDFSGRPALHITKTKGVKFSKLKNYSFHDSKEFLQAFSQHSALTMHIEILSGADAHHIIEAIFKCIGKALDQATSLDSRVRGIPSTKGTI